MIFFLCLIVSLWLSFLGKGEKKEKIVPLQSQNNAKNNANGCYQQYNL